MVFDCEPVSEVPGVASGWTASGAGSRVRRGRPLDSPDGCSLEGFTTGFSISYNVLATLPRVDGRRHLGASVDSATPSARPARTDRPRAGDRRWNIFLGKKGGECVGKTKRGKGTKIMLLVDATGLPLAANIHSASPNEVTLIEPLLKSRLLRRRIKRLIFDKAADSDPLRDRLQAQGIDLICPHRINRSKPARQDGRKFRRYRIRYRVERSIAWLQNFRRLVTRYEHKAYLFLGFVQLACLIVTLRRF
jgi:transposase